MAAPVSTDSVWRALGENAFAVLSWVTPKGEARSAGIVYLVKGRKLIIGTESDSWKARQIRANPHVSITAVFKRRIFFLPWIAIPDATIIFRGRARVIEPKDIDQQILHELEQGMEPDPERNANTCFVEITPAGDFLTYGIDVPAAAMGDPQKAMGRVAVSSGGVSDAKPG
ncbi:MAG: pyridoxamine 5'-phosphate oxidase family protein [Gammaproteobacteria bacterium]